MCARLRWLRCGAFSLVMLGTTGCGAEPGGETTTAPPTDDDAGGSSSGGGEETGDAQVAGGANVCLQALSIGAGVQRGELAGRDSSHAGPCGAGGPDVFFALDVPVRADIFVAAYADLFDPKIGVLGNDCAANWEDASLLCAPSVGGWIIDVAAGTRAWVSVGWEEDPGLEATSLPFELEVQYRRVLEAGALCEPASLGRCEGGTVCGAPSNNDPARCQVIPGDRCSNALEVQLTAGETDLSIAADAVHTDAHAHSCGGARTAERVYRLSVAAGEAGGQLEVDAPDASLVALRGPTCLPDDELDCVAAPLAHAAAAELGAGGEIYLFVELMPPSDEEMPVGEEAPQIVHIRLTTID